MLLGFIQTYFCTTLPSLYIHCNTTDKICIFLCRLTIKMESNIANIEVVPQKDAKEMEPKPKPDLTTLNVEVRGVKPRTVGTAPPTVHLVRQNTVGQVMLYGVNIVSLVIDAQERLCLAQISNTLLKVYSYNEIHNRRVALGITCVQCTPVQLEILRRAGAMPVSSRRCGMISKREAERLVKSFLDDIRPPKLPDNFAFDVKHECGWGGRGSFMPSRYNSSRAKCIKCHYCNMYFSPNKFIFHFHRTPDAKYNHPDAANFNSWRRHLKLYDDNHSQDLLHAWEDVKAMFNGGSRKRVLSYHSSIHSHSGSSSHKSTNSSSSSNIPKRPKMDSENADSNVLSPGSQHVYPGQYPVFPVPNKVMPVKSMPTHPAFSLPFGYDKPAMSPEIQNSVKPNMVTTWSAVPETYYPPYEMIWAKHLGLTSAESNFVPHPGMPNQKLSPRESMDHSMHGNSHNEGLAYDENRRPMTDNGIENDFNILDKTHRPHLSAFKPVHKTVHGSSSGLPSPSHSDQDDRLGSPASHTDTHDSITRDSDDFDNEEHVDVDTIDDCEQTVSGAASLRRAEENNNEMLSPKLPVIIEPTCTSPEKGHFPDTDENFKGQEDCNDNQSEMKMAESRDQDYNDSESTRGQTEEQESETFDDRSVDEDSRSSCRSPDSGCDKGEPETPQSSAEQSQTSPSMPARQFDKPNNSILVSMFNYDLNICDNYYFTMYLYFTF